MEQKIFFIKDFNVKALLVWLFGFAPFFKVITELHWVVAQMYPFIYKKDKCV